jgi:predicted DNA binding CopG/RHH family protein
VLEVDHLQREYLRKFEAYAGLAAGRCCITMGVMAADAFIHCRVTSDVKALVRRLAEREGINESTLVKQLLEFVLRTSAMTELPAPAALDKVNRGARVYVRLAAEDWRLLKARSTARDVPSATYVALLVRSHLRGAAPLPKAEYLALKQSVLELTALGRNLNQIARMMNQGGRPALPGRAEVGAMLKIAEGLRDHFKGLLKANERSWRGNAETIN